MGIEFLCHCLGGVDDATEVILDLQVTLDLLVLGIIGRVAFYEFHEKLRGPPGLLKKHSHCSLGNSVSLRYLSLFLMSY